MFLKSFALALCYLTLSSFANAACDDPPRLRFSVIPETDAKKVTSNFGPLLRDLEKELKRPVEIVIPSSYGTVIEGLLAGNIDLAMMGPASYVSAKNRDPGVRAFASIVKKAGPFNEDGATYRSMLIVRRDSPFQTIESLKGKRVLLVDPASTSGSVIPKYLVAQLVGSPLENYFGRVSYSGGHDKSVSLVMGGQADAAFVASSLLADFISSGKADKADFRVLWRSDSMPLDPFVFRIQLCESIRMKIEKTFLGNAGKSYPPTLDAMSALRFVPVSDVDYKKMREILLAAP